MTIARAFTSGTKVGIATGAGITARDSIHTVFTVAGISALIAASAMLFSIIKHAGAAYLFFPGIKAILEKSPVMPGTVRFVSPLTEHFIKAS